MSGHRMTDIFEKCWPFWRMTSTLGISFPPLYIHPITSNHPSLTQILHFYISCFNLQSQHALCNTMPSTLTTLQHCAVLRFGGSCAHLLLLSHVCQHILWIYGLSDESYLSDVSSLCLDSSDKSSLWEHFHFLGCDRADQPEEMPPKVEQHTNQVRHEVNQRRFCHPNHFGYVFGNIFKSNYYNQCLHPAVCKRVYTESRDKESIFRVHLECHFKS